MKLNYLLLCHIQIDILPVHNIMMLEGAHLLLGLFELAVKSLYNQGESLADIARCN